MNIFDKYINQKIQDDQLSFNANPAIKQRLMYHMQIKSAKAEVRKNSIIPSIGALLSSKFLAWKIGVLTIFLVSFMGYHQMNENSPLIHLSDTAQVVSVLDTTNILIEDSVLRN